MVALIKYHKDGHA